MEYIEMFNNEKMMKVAINAVIDYHNTTNEFSFICKDDVCIVWFCKTLQNFKVILATPLLNNKFYEFTYNGNNKEAYLDIYDKIGNKIIGLNNV